MIVLIPKRVRLRHAGMENALRERSRPERSADQETASRSAGCEEPVDATSLRAVYQLANVSGL